MPTATAQSPQSPAQEVGRGLGSRVESAGFGVLFQTIRVVSCFESVCFFAQHNRILTCDMGGSNENTKSAPIVNLRHYELHSAGNCI